MERKIPRDWLRNKSIRSYLEKLDLGHEATPRSWLYEHENVETVFGKWKKAIDAKVTQKEILQLEAKAETKVGPQGGTPIGKEAKRTLDDQFLPGLPTPVFSTGQWIRAIERLSVKLRPSELIKPDSITRVLIEMSRDGGLTTNSGYPDFRTRRTAVDNARRDAQSGRWKDYPAIVLYRCYNGKLRSVWMYPMSANVKEAQVTGPLLRHLRSYPGFEPWIGFYKVQEVISKWYDENAFIYGGDVSAMDAHFKRKCGEQVLAVILPWLTPEAQIIAKETIDRLFSIPLLISSKTMFTGEHGVASGSGWTNMIETLFQAIIMEYFEVPMMMIGDDQVMRFSTGPKAEDVTRIYNEAGLPSNIQKQSDVAESVLFLQRVFIKQYKRDDGLTRAVYPTMRALNSLVFPERYWSPKTWNSDMFCFRTYSILENTRDHPLFREFVEYVAKGQKDLLAFAKLKSSKLDSIQKQASAVRGILPSYNQVGRDEGLAGFEAIKVAASL